MVPDGLAERGDLSIAAKFVLSYMARKANSQGKWTGGIRLLAAVFGTGRSQASRAIHELESAGLLTAERGKSGQRATYLLAKASQIATLPDPQSVPNSNGASQIATQASQIAALSASPPHTPPLKKKQKPSESKKKTPLTPLPEVLNTAEFRKVWEEWKAYRKQRRQTLTAIGTKRQLSKLARWGVGPATQQLIQAMEQGWQGPIDPSERSGQPQKRLGQVVAPEGKYPD